MSGLDDHAFKHPPAEYRSIPFWSLNDLLDPVEIKNQLARFAEGGFGGAYLHSRTGLLTEYLADDWWAAIQAACEQCEELGLEAWFYDEEKWPSGFAGGIVPNQSEDYHARTLVRLPLGTELPPRCELLKRDNRYMYVSCKEAMGNSWFNGTCWVDLMNPDTVKAFIDCSYAPYVEKYKSYIRKNTAKGMFTDEPQISPREPGFAHLGIVSYSPRLRAFFSQQHGYDMLDHVHALFENTGNYRKVRLDYYRSMASLLESSFSRQIGQYCQQEGLRWTGHYNGENSMGSILLNVGNMMIQYRHMQQPGIDHLGLGIDGGLIAAKSLTSVANQYGMERRLSELFGISGQNMSFDDRKWIAGWHAVLGINHFCPHLALYSMKGCRKRDYPPTLSPQQPYWKHNKLAEDYMSRICYMTAQGEFAPELLVIHPLESCFMEVAGPDVVSINSVSTVSINERDGRFIGLLERLMNIHRDYDLGDEQIIQDIGSVIGNEMHVGKMRYKAVFLPYMSTIRPSTLLLLESFANNGGLVYVVGGFPAYVDGMELSMELEQLKAYAVPVLENQLEAVLAQGIKPSLHLFGEGISSVWTQQRSFNNGKIIFFANISRSNEVEFSFALEDQADPVVLWDPVTGKSFRLKQNSVGSYDIKLDPASSFMVTTGGASQGAKLAGPYRVPEKFNQVMALDGPWQGIRKDPNMLTLDFARYSTDDGLTFSAPEPIIGIHERFTAQGYNGTLVLEFSFAATVVPMQSALVIEQPEMYTEISVNGSRIMDPGKSTYIDAAFRQIDISGSLKLGTNTITLKLDYIAPVPDSSQAIPRYGSEIESLYIAGEFGIESQPSSGIGDEELSVHRLGSFTVEPEKTTFTGDLSIEGYPFYAGEFELECSFVLPAKLEGSRYYLTFPGMAAITAAGELNGRELGVVTGEPWRFEVTPALLEGENRLKLTLANSLRNLLGPHHHVGGELTKVGPESFTGQTSWTYGGAGEANWYDVRLSGQPNLWRDDYAIVPFGLTSPPVLLTETKPNESGGSK